MVRQKNRWLLVQFDFEADIMASCSDESAAAPITQKGKGKKRKLLQQSSSSLGGSSSSSLQQASIGQINSTDIYRSIQESIAQNFGLAGASTTDVQVRLYDPMMRMAVIRTSRDGYPAVRSAVTLVSQIKQGGDVVRVVPSTVAVCGSARTARNAAWDMMQKRFFGQELAGIGVRKGEPWSKKSRVAMEKGLQDLEDRMEKIDSGV